MSLRGSSSPPEKSKKPKGGGFKPAGGSSGSSSGGASYTPGGGASYTPGGSGGSSSGGSSGSGTGGSGFKFPGFGGGGGSGLDKLWGDKAAAPGPMSTMSDSARMGVAIGAGILILGAVVLLVFGIAKGSKKTVGMTGVEGGATTLFQPPTSSNGSKTDMPIVFTDGTTADLLYDPGLNLDSLGVYPTDSGSENGVARGADQFEIDHGGASFAGTESPFPGQVTYPGPSNSPVPLVSAATNNQGQNVNGNWLDFHFGDWRVGVWEGTGSEKMSTTDDQTWAANITGTVTSSGWLILGGTGPVHLTPYGQPDGPGLVFGNISQSGIILTPETCSPPVGADVVNNTNGVPVMIQSTGNGTEEGLLCIKSASMVADVYGPTSFVQSAADSLDVQNVKQGPARPAPASSPSS